MLGYHLEKWSLSSWFKFFILSCNGTVEDKEAPVRACYRYINNRPNYLDYKGAIENDLPVGSGEIESAHRYISQNRLKIAGSWWREDNCSDMLALRICRANNGDWDTYWRKASWFG